MTIKEWLLAILCLFYSVWHGRARHGRAPRRVVILQMAKLGDMVCTTPIFRAIKNKYPQTHLTVVGNAAYIPLLAHNPDVDAYVPFQGVFSTIFRLRSGHYDFACLMEPSTTLLAILYLSGIRGISTSIVQNGHSHLQTQAYTFLCSFVITKPHTMSTYAPREYLRLLEPIGITTEDTTKHLAFDEKDQHDVEHVLERFHLTQKDFIIGMSPSSGNKIKQWPPERFAAVADSLIEIYGAQIILIGTTRDKEEIATMMVHVRNRSAIHDAQGLFSIGALKALMPRLALFISVDTGPIYIAEAFDTPTVDITGPIDEREQPPIGLLHRVVTPPSPRVPQLFVMNAREYDAVEARRQAQSITVPMVLEACNALLRSERL